LIVRTGIKKITPPNGGVIRFSLIGSTQQQDEDDQRNWDSKKP
jgi:hypothetical protein